MVHVGALFKDRLHSAVLSIRDEHLSETGAAHQSDQLFHTQEVQLVEDVIKQ